ncbi:uncharacterized protein L3040_005696 [Drepanopeziza brunnea f. sp. 'multigermtubi']|uniref:uncharacterized protein n=1 Tax=Drepanopeziza brunnea f. sp. 'multigermtubi' TaxID=698441 RepID=UPI0023A6863D|nr:hypothetical protein L3040_005696 [Drepanopeziza brunnea f. sp. 'multigermtubi']
MASPVSSAQSLLLAQKQTPIEADSADAESPDASTRSLTSDAANFEEENGRTYHGYRAGTYPFPNDASENERLDSQYLMLKYTFEGRNYFAPLSNPKRILDIGTGTGRWATEMGDEFPDAEVQATDLSPIQPSCVPVNVHFFIDDASEEDWAVPAAYFDFIHTRLLIGCFTDFRDIIRKAFYYTKPGGWMESQEFLSTPLCDDGTMPKDWPFLDWTNYVEDASVASGRPLRIAHKLKRWYEEVGFVDVQERIFRIPINPWPREKHLKAIGRQSELNCLDGLSGFSMRYFSRNLKWTKTEIEVYLVNVRSAISDRSVHAYHRAYVVWGRKPLESEVSASSRTGPAS